MTAICPAAPLAPAVLAVSLIDLPKGARLVRFHTPDYPGNSFNPNIGKAMEDATEGARFSPFADAAGINVPSIYAGTTDFAAALESVFHDIRHVPDPPYPESKLKSYALSRLSVNRPIKLLELVNPQLRQIAVPHRLESIQEGELIHSSPAQYPATRSWACHFHRSLKDLEGLVWRPRLGGEGVAYVFFGDRVTSSDFTLTEDRTPIHVEPARSLIDAIASTAHIKIIGAK
jgi:hypothetical protein